MCDYLREYLTFFVENSNEFSNYLTSGDLTCKSSVKLDLPGYDSVTPILKTLCLNFSLVVVETLENHASLFTSSIQNHPVCILIKYMVTQHLFNIIISF